MILQKCLTAWTIVWVLASVMPSALRAQQPFEHTGASELFIDDVRIAESSGVVRIFHPAHKREAPVLEPEQPWEGNNAYIYGTVHYDKDTGRFRMWYNASGLCYAESDDGIHWVRPTLGLHEFEGSTENNIVIPEQRNSTVLVDESGENPDERYKALFGGRNGYKGAYSADGIHWSMYNDGKTLLPYGSELSSINRDPQTGEYQAYIRTGPPKLDEHGIKVKRTCSLTTSSDFRTWSEPVLTIEPDAVDDGWVMGPDQATEFYGWNGFRYGSQYLGFLTVFRITGLIREHPSSQSAWDGPIDVQLVHSRDGMTWHRTKQRTAVVENGPYAYDAGTILDIANNPIEVGDELWLYYTAINTTHGGERPPKRASVALATWPRDRLVSLGAGWAEGVVRTETMTAKPGRLIVNADAGKGDLIVEVLDDTGEPLPGFSAADCRAITTDALDHHVTWAGGDRLAFDRPFALRFRFHHANLYSYRVSE
ncbi:MAG: hypothetical protein R3C45_15350 [Phycisphaerales bacterium]